MNATAAAVENVPPPAPAAVQNFSQSYSAPVRSFYSDTYHAVGRKGVTPAAATPVAVTQGGAVLGVLAPQQQVPGSKSDGFTGADVVMADTKMTDAGAVGGVQGGDIPDVDTDSAGMMETLMRNLQRAARQGQV
jgi:hypothetical protein